MGLEERVCEENVERLGWRVRESEKEGGMRVMVRGQG